MSVPGRGERWRWEGVGLGSVECSAGGGDIVSGLDGLVEWTIELLMGDCVNNYVEASTIACKAKVRRRSNVTCELGAAGTFGRLHRNCRVRGLNRKC